MLLVKGPGESEYVKGGEDERGDIFLLIIVLVLFTRLWRDRELSNTTLAAVDK